MNHPGVDKVDLSLLSEIGCGAAYLPPDLAAKLEALIPKTADISGGGWIMFPGMLCLCSLIHRSSRLRNDRNRTL